jgi:hypothetical protein
MQELFLAFPALMSRFEDNDHVLSAFVFAAWRKTAGGQLRQRTEPVEFRQKRLTLAVENEIWQRHLRDLTGDMLFRLNAILGQGVVTFIELRVDEGAVLNAADRKPLRETKDEIRTTVPPSLKKAALQIADKNLREAFLTAAGAYLARQ